MSDIIDFEQINQDKNYEDGDNDKKEEERLMIQKDQEEKNYSSDEDSITFDNGDKEKMKKKKRETEETEEDFFTDNNEHSSDNWEIIEKTKGVHKETCETSLPDTNLPTATETTISPSAATLISSQKKEDETTNQSGMETNRDEPLKSHMNEGTSVKKGNQLVSIVKEKEANKKSNNEDLNRKNTTKDNTVALVQRKTEEENKKAGGTDEEGKKVCAKISGIGPGGFRNLGSGSLKSPSMPLLLSMPSGSGGLSLLSAGLPPGRYVILPSTTSSIPSISSIASTTTQVGNKATMIAQVRKPPPVFTSSCTGTTTTTATTNIPSILIPPPCTAAAAAAAALGRVMRPPPIGRGGYAVGSISSIRSVRGRRKSYTAAEKLAMIEAVESGQKKSNVADLFGVAPSTLACILLQKGKIRSDQMKVDLSRRRLRQSRQTPIVPALVPRITPAPLGCVGGAGEGEGQGGAARTPSSTSSAPSRHPDLQSSRIHQKRLFQLVVDLANFAPD